MSISGAEAQRSATQRDLEATPDDGNLWEVIDGRIYVTPQATVAHQNVVTQLTGILNAHVRRHGLGKVFTSSIKVVLDEPTGVGPDIVFISTARLDGLRDDGFYGAPDLIVEVLSSKPALDRIVKRDRYARAGVPEYWIADPVQRTLEAYTLKGDRYELVAQRSEAERFEPPPFPGLVVELVDLWL